MSEPTRKTDGEIRARLKMLDDHIVSEKTKPKPHTGAIIFLEGKSQGLRWVLGEEP